MKQTKLQSYHIQNCPVLNYSFSLDTKGPLNPASEGNRYLYVSFNHFRSYFVMVPSPEKIAHCALNAIFRHLISKFCPLQQLTTNE